MSSCLFRCKSHKPTDILSANSANCQTLTCCSLWILTTIHFSIYSPTDNIKELYYEMKTAYNNSSIECQQCNLTTSKYCSLWTWVNIIFVWNIMYWILTSTVVLWDTNLCIDWKKYSLDDYDILLLVTMVSTSFVWDCKLKFTNSL